MAESDKVNMNIKVSVLMSVYNTRLTYLREAVDSILCQADENMEFVIIDDCSTEPGVVNYLNELKKNDTRIVLIKNDSNLGLTKSLNVGIERCRGEYIVRMDSDDISMPDRIRTQIEYLDSHPEVSLVGSNMIIFGETHISEPQLRDRTLCDDPEIYVIRSLIQHSGPPHPTFVFRKNFLDSNRIRYREDILKAQDYGIMVDILKVGGVIRRINLPLIKYRIHDDQISSSSEIEQLAYQSRISFDYLTMVFPFLSNEERMAIAFLGYYGKIKELVEGIRGKESLQKTCSFVLDNLEYIYDPRVYIRAIKKIIKFNRESQVYNGQKLETELRYELWKRAIRLSKELGRPWGMWPYTLMSYRFVRRRCNL